MDGFACHKARKIIRSKLHLENTRAQPSNTYVGYVLRAQVWAPAEGVRLAIFNLRLELQRTDRPLSWFSSPGHKIYFALPLEIKMNAHVHIYTYTYDICIH